MYEGSLKILIKAEIINLPKYNIILSVRHIFLSFFLSLIVNLRFLIHMPKEIRK